MDKNDQPMTVDFALIERLGINRVAGALDLSAGAVRRWRSRGVPKEREAAIAELAGMKGKQTAVHTGTGWQDSETAPSATPDNRAGRPMATEREANDVRDHDSDARGHEFGQAGLAVGMAVMRPGFSRKVCRRRSRSGSIERPSCSLALD